MDRSRVALEDDVDLVEVESVWVVGQQPERAREVRGVLDHQHPVGVCAGMVKGVHRRPGMQREAAEPVSVGCGCRGGHDPWRERLDDRGEPPEVGGHVLHVRSAVTQEALSRPEEPTAVVHCGVREHRVQICQQRTERLQVHPVVATAERVQQGAGVRRAEPDRERVRRTDERRCLGWRIDPACGHGGSSRPRPLVLRATVTH